MSRKGGYKIIDLKGYDFSSADMVIDGIYDTIESNYGKPLLFTGIVIDGVEKDDVYAMAETNGSSYRVTLYDKVVTISNLDVVSSKNTYTELTIRQENYTLDNGKYLISIKDVPLCSFNIGSRVALTSYGVRERVDFIDNTNNAGNIIDIIAGDNYFILVTTDIFYFLDTQV